MKQIPTTHPKQTPQKKLLAEKKRLKKLNRLQKEKLNTDFLYMQENAGWLFLSGASSLFSTAKHAKTKGQKTTDQPYGALKSQNALTGTTDTLSLGTRLLPAIWEIAQPFILTWGIRRMKKWVGGFFTSKKKQAAKN